MHSDCSKYNRDYFICGLFEWHRHPLCDLIGKKDLKAVQELVNSGTVCPCVSNNRPIYEALKIGAYDIVEYFGRDWRVDVHENDMCLFRKAIRAGEVKWCLLLMKFPLENGIQPGSKLVTEVFKDIDKACSLYPHRVEHLRYIKKWFELNVGCWGYN